jgi:hypothetical protein
MVPVFQSNERYTSNRTVRDPEDFCPKSSRGRSAPPISETRAIDQSRYHRPKMSPPRTGRRSLRRSSADAAPYYRKAKVRQIKKDRQHRKASGSPTMCL